VGSCRQRVALLAVDEGAEMDALRLQFLLFKLAHRQTSILFVSSAKKCIKILGVQTKNQRRGGLVLTARRSD
jgi:hypothetical protein